MTPKSALNHNEKVSDAEREPTIRKVADRLAPRFPATPRHRIEGIVAEEYDSLETGRIRIYIPTLIENSARTRLHRELKNLAVEDPLPATAPRDFGHRPGQAHPA